MYRKRAQENERVKGEQPGIMFVNGAEKCGMGNEVLDWSFCGYVRSSSSVYVTRDRRTVRWKWMQSLE